MSTPDVATLYLIYQCVTHGSRMMVMTTDVSCFSPPHMILDVETYRQLKNNNKTLKKSFSTALVNVIAEQA